MWHREAASSRPASDGLMLFKSCIGSPLDANLQVQPISFPKRKGHLLLLEVDQVLVVLEDLDISECAPGILNFFCCNDVFRFLGYLLSPLLVASPCPLNLDRSDMVHGEAMVLEKTSSEGHLVRCLDQAGTKVSHALLLILRHHVES